MSARGQRGSGSQRACTSSRRVSAFDSAQPHNRADALLRADEAAGTVALALTHPSYSRLVSLNSRAGQSASDPIAIRMSSRKHPEVSARPRTAHPSDWSISRRVLDGGVGLATVKLWDRSTGSACVKLATWALLNVLVRIGSCEDPPNHGTRCESRNGNAFNSWWMRAMRPQDAFGVDQTLRHLNAPGGRGENQGTRFSPRADRDVPVREFRTKCTEMVRLNRVGNLYLYSISFAVRPAARCNQNWATPDASAGLARKQKKA